MIAFLFLLSIQLLLNIEARQRFDFQPTQYPVPHDAGDPLILTPLIEAGQIKEAQTKARVHYKDFDPIESYSGYFTVDKVHDNNLFFWFFPSEDSYKNDPVVLWLEGGPGAPSVNSLFAEHGAFIVDEDYNVSLREYRWSKNHSVIYIDNPVGTGFSFSNGDGYAKNQTKVGTDLYDALLQFFTLFPELQNNDFFITGESYAGKYVPAVAYTILQNNPTAKLKLNLKGLAIGNGLCDPVNQADYADYVYQIGLVDANTRDTLLEYKGMVEKYSSEGNWTEATRYFKDVMLGLIDEATQIENIYNYIQNYPNPPEPYIEFVQTQARSALHVGDIVFGNGPVFQYLYDDITKSVAPWISKLLSNYKVLLYSGQIDVIVAYPLTLNFLQKLEFSAADEYKVAPRTVWKDSDSVVGYYKIAGNLTEMLIRNAGHMVSIEQPKHAFSMIYSFTRSLPLNTSVLN